MNQQIVGTLVGQEARSNGWVAFSILAPGKEHPLKLSTKRADLIGNAQQMIGQVVTAGYNEQQSTTPNPHRPGEYFINRYLEAIAFGQVDLVGAPTQIQPQQQMPQQPQPQPQQFQGQPQTFAQQPAAVPFIDPKQGMIHRQCGTKVAVQLLQYLAPEERNLASLVRISEQLVKYYDEGVQWTTPPVQQPQAQAQQQHQGFDGEAHDAQRQALAQQGLAEQSQQGYEQPDEYGDIPF